MNDKALRTRIDYLECRDNAYNWHMKAILKVVQEQKRDSVLNLPVGTCEDYVKYQIKRLHAVIEGEKL